jgi:ribosomal protein S18 acetylase RimI-like enzyme
MTNLAFGSRPAVLRCGRCGRFVDWEGSQLQVVCSCRPHLELPPVVVREAQNSERAKALELFKRHFGPAQLVAYGRAVNLEEASALVAETENEIAGALAWRTFEGAFHIVALATEPMWQRAGVGGHLVAEAEVLARVHGRPRIVVTITNDNLPALYFYQRRGYRFAAIVRDSAFSHAPGKAPTGFAGIPIRDEVQLVKEL